MKIPELKSQHIWAVLIIAFLIPAISPLGSPFPMSDVTMQIYNVMEALPKGSIVLVGGSAVFAFDLESSAGMIACLKQMARKGLRMVTLPLGVEAVQLHKFCIDAAGVDKSKGGPWEYGKDYVLLPYIPGAGAAIVSFLTDVQKTVSVDLAGTPLSQIPLMKDFRNYKDVAVFICPHWGFVDIVRYATGEFGVTSISFAQSTAYAFFSPYMQAYPGKVFMTNGYLGGAQYERLNNIKGLGHKVIDSYTLVSILIVGFITLGNVTMYTKMKEPEKEEEVEKKE